MTVIAYYAKSADRTSSSNDAYTNFPFQSDELPPVTWSTSDEVDAVIREKARAQRLYHYLKAIVRTRDIDIQTGEFAWIAWNYLSDAMLNRLSVPDACPGVNGQLLYTWDRDEHHLEIEIFPRASAEFFYRNRISGQLWEDDYEINASLPEEAIAKLNYFLKP